MFSGAKKNANKFYENDIMQLFSADTIKIFWPQKHEKIALKICS